MSSVFVVAGLLLTSCAGQHAAEPQTDTPQRAPRDEARPSVAVGHVSSSPEPAGTSCPPLEVDVPPLLEEPLNPPAIDIEDEQQRILGPFYEKLARLIRGNSRDHVRIGFYGDSNMTLDLISGSMRRALQQKYGDGGHGYVAVGKPWRWYAHLDVKHDHFGEWATFSPSTVRVKDFSYGLGGIVSATRSIGAKAVFKTAGDDSPVGRTASRFGVFHDVRSSGGTFDIIVDGAVVDTVDTSQGEGKVGYRVARVKDAAHEFEVLNTGRKLIRIFGVVLERDEPGIVLDCLGIGGVSYFDLGRLDPEVNASMLQHRPYDLVMFLIGANTWKAYENPAAVAKLATVHRSHRKDQPILIMSPPDHTKTTADATSDPQFVKIADALRKAAHDNDCAYWDLRAAMGGDGSMARFFHANLAAKDLYHFTRKGAAFMGNRALNAIFRGFESYAKTHPDAGCTPE